MSKNINFKPVLEIQIHSKREIWRRNTLPSLHYNISTLVPRLQLMMRNGPYTKLNMQN